MTIADEKVPIHFVQSLLATAESSGCDIEELTREFDFSPQELAERSFFSAVQYGKLYQRLMLMSQDECFGMMSGGKVRPGSFRLMCLTLIQCENLRQAVVRSGEFSEICRGFLIRPRIMIEEGDCVSVRMAGIESLPEHEFEQLMSADNADRILTSMAVWHRVHCWLVGKEIPLRKVCLKFPRPKSFRVLAEFYPENIEFDQDYNGFIFERRLLDARVVQNSQTLDEFVRRAPYHLVISDSIQSSLKTQVRTILSKDVSESMLGAEAVASRLNLSVTTLRRRLQSENTSFQKIKDECRLEAAVHFLGCPDLTNAVIADRLGFDETSAFFRAFKKWTGLTPGEYRRQIAEGADINSSYLAIW